MLKLILLFLSLNIQAQVSFGPLYNHSEEESKIVKIAEELSNKILNSSCFNDFMVSRELRKTNGLTRSEVVLDLKSKNLSVPVTMYHRKLSGVAGYRKPPSDMVYTNRKYHSGASACSRGSNLLHEWSHVAGYDHSFKPHKLRPYSVPYSINKAFESCCACNGVEDCIILDKPDIKEEKTICFRPWYFLWFKKICYTKTL